MACAGSLVLKFYDVQPDLAAEFQQLLNEPASSKRLFSIVESHLKITGALSTIAVFKGDNDSLLGSRLTPLKIKF